MTDDAETMLIREFATALRRAREEETERMRNVLYGLKLLRDGLADLIAEMRENAAASDTIPPRRTNRRELKSR
jgi:hypothetical protein